jgi:hypothetical protein
MRDSSIPPDCRMKAAQAALPYTNSKLTRSPATDPAVSAKQVETLSAEEAIKQDPMYEAILAWEREG